MQQLIESCGGEQQLEGNDWLAPHSATIFLVSVTRTLRLQRLESPHPLHLAGPIRHGEKGGHQELATAHKPPIRWPPEGRASRPAAFNGMCIKLELFAAVNCK
jgi:hypothetical protein